MCELCEPQCICVAAGVAVARGARISVASRGDTGLREECPSQAVLHSAASQAFIRSHNFSQEVILDLSERPSTLYMP